jgi:beta-lactamase regulating signal transducer with metallopeptidase domain
MMTSLGWMLAWCAVQVGILAGLGVGAAWALGRRSPAAAATAAAAAAAMVALVTLLAPAPMPRLIGEWRVSSSAKPQAAGRAGRAADSATNSDVPALSLSDLVNGAARLLGPAKLSGGGIGARGFVVVGVVAAGAAVGTWRLFVAWRYVAGLRRSAAPIKCTATRRAFAELAGAMGVHRRVALCESPRVVSPAVIGWRRPIVLLPPAYGTWPATQLRAALAHELAHVARGDFFWRATAGAALAIHFYHPLVHWLARRLALVQELAADERAAAASGGAAGYVRALSELAIRLDEQPRLRAEPLVLPAFNSNLIRRITMLRSKEGCQWKNGGRLSGAVAAGVIALVAVGALVLRSAAEPAVDGATEAMFARAPIDPSVITGLEDGMFVVRLSELASRPQFVPLVELIRTNCRPVWKDLFGGPAPDLNFDGVEYVAGVPQVTIGELPEAVKKQNPEANSRLMIGCGELVVRFKHDVAWRQWVTQYIPLAKDKTAEGFDYVELPAIPAIGQVPLLMAARDGRTLVFTGGNVERLRKLATASPGSGPAASASGWTSLDGGLATMLASAKNIDRDTPTPEAPQAQVVLRELQQVGFAFDLDARSETAGVRMDVTCKDAAAAERVRSAVAELLPLALATIHAEIENPEIPTGLPPEQHKKLRQTAGDANTDREVAEFWLNALKTCTVRVESSGDGSARVRLSAVAPFPTHVMTAYEVADKAERTGAAKR